MSSNGTFRYDGLFCDLYDCIPCCAKRPDHEFYVSYARAANGPTLELGCGTGRLLIRTAAAGCSVVGLDLSPAMLAKSAEKLQRHPQKTQKRAQLVRGDMTRFQLGRMFGLVTIPYRGFQHLLTVKEQLSCLRCVNRHLRFGGRLILDLLHAAPEETGNPRWHKEVLIAQKVQMPDGRKFRVTSRVAEFHPLGQYNDLETIFYVTHPDGRKQRVVQTFPFRYVFRFEAEHLLARCGFRVARLFGSFSKIPLRKGSRDLIIVAEKIWGVPGS
jgi:SAM-dependent methyltransferase